MFVKSWKSPLAMALGLLVIPVMLVYAADDDLYFSPVAVSQIPDIRDLVGYQPASSMFDQSRIDLDMAMMNSLLADIETAAAFPSEMYDASRIYSNGAFSKPYASVSLNDPLPLDLPDGTPLVATRNEDYDGTVLGLVLDDTPKGSTSLKFQYDFFADTNSTALSCYVGGLAKGDAFVEGCLALNGTISVDTRNENTVPIITMAYSYSIEQNLNDRSLSKFSSDAQTLMYQCPQCPYNTYQKFYDYYGAYDYANKFINMAIDAGTTSFDMGSADFAFVGLEGRAEFISKGALVLNVWMFVVRQMEFALDSCISGRIEVNDDAITAWDEAVAYYVGSVEDGATDLPNDDDSLNRDKGGVMLYALANNQCTAFHTCGEGGKSNTGTAYVNQVIMKAFQDGQFALNNGKCDVARERKNEILNMMKVPLIQGTLRYAYALSEGTIQFEPQREKAQWNAASAAFAASILPMVHDCNSEHAAIVFDNLHMISADEEPQVNFLKVKQALQANYHCMGVTCASVGSLWQGYFEDGAACSDSGPNVGAIVGGVLGGLLAVALIGYLWCRCRRRSRDAKDASFGTTTEPYTDTPVPPQSAFSIDGGTIS